MKPNYYNDKYAFEYRSNEGCRKVALSPPKE